MIHICVSFSFWYYLLFIPPFLSSYVFGKKYKGLEAEAEVPAAAAAAGGGNAAAAAATSSRGRARKKVNYSELNIDKVSTFLLWCWLFLFLMYHVALERIHERWSDMLKTWSSFQISNMMIYMIYDCYNLSRGMIRISFQRRLLRLGLISTTCPFMSLEVKSPFPWQSPTFIWHNLASEIFASTSKRTQDGIFNELPSQRMRRRRWVTIVVFSLSLILFICNTC